VCFLAGAAPSGESLLGEGLVWLIGAVVCLLAACRGSNCTLTRAMDGRNLRCSTIGSCQSTATSYDCTARLVVAALQVSGAIEESDLYLFITFTEQDCKHSSIPLQACTQSVQGSHHLRPEVFYYPCRKWQRAVAESPQSSSPVRTHERTLDSVSS